MDIMKLNILQEKQIFFVKLVYLEWITAKLSILDIFYKSWTKIKYVCGNVFVYKKILGSEF